MICKNSFFFEKTIFKSQNIIYYHTNQNPCHFVTHYEY